MKTIWKYELEAGETKLEMPVGAEVLTVQFQGPSLCLWARVDTHEKSKVVRRFVPVGTGQDLEGAGLREGDTYIGTVQMSELGIPLVFHVFEMDG